MCVVHYTVQGLKLYTNAKYKHGEKMLKLISDILQGIKTNAVEIIVVFHIL